jgi:hypothetical protein
MKLSEMLRQQAVNKCRLYNWCISFEHSTRQLHKGDNINTIFILVVLHGVIPLF